MARCPAQLHEAWGALSRACHHHPYELAPTAGELSGWIEAVEAFANGGEAGDVAKRPL